MTILKKAATVAAVLAIGALAGCVTMPPAQPDPGTIARQQAADQGTCQQFGFHPGTESYAQCMMTTAQRRQQAQADVARQAANSRATMLQQMIQQEQAQKTQQDRDAAAKAQADEEAATRERIKAGEDLENKMAADQGYGPKNTGLPPEPEVPKVEAVKIPSLPTGSNCTTTSTTQQGENAGSVTSTTECH